MPDDSITLSTGSAPVAGAGTGNGYGAYSAGAATDTGFSQNQDAADLSQGADGFDDLDESSDGNDQGAGAQDDASAASAVAPITTTKPNATGGADSVPWGEDPRWKAWKEREREFEAFSPIIEELRQQGLGSAQEVYNRLAEQQEQAKVAEYRAELQNRVDLGEITEELANRLLQAEHAQMSLARSQQVITRQLTDQAISAVRSNVLPDMTPEVEKHLRSLPPEQVQVQAQLIKAQSELIVKQELAKYQAQKQKDASVRAPERAGGTAPPIPAGGNGGNQNAADAVLGQLPAHLRPWSSLFPSSRGSS